MPETATIACSFIVNLKILLPSDLIYYSPETR